MLNKILITGGLLLSAHAFGVQIDVSKPVTIVPPEGVKTKSAFFDSQACRETVKKLYANMKMDAGTKIAMELDLQRCDHPSRISENQDRPQPVQEVEEAATAE